MKPLTINIKRIKKNQGIGISEYDPPKIFLKDIGIDIERSAIKELSMLIFLLHKKYIRINNRDEDIKTSKLTTLEFRLYDQHIIIYKKLI